MNPSTAFGRVFVDELIRCGVREAVLAPGSRSAPLAMALSGRAAGDGAGRPGLRLHLRTDERSAAFLALGLAKASGRPAVVACTSGTAAAHFHAAVIEADEAGLPLIVLTADRPPELRGTGASQTIDQLKLYGAAVRWFCEAGVPEERTGTVGYWRSLACRAWAMASGAAGGLPGPVHVNIPFRDPLLPDSEDAGGPDAAGALAAGGAAGPGGWPEPLDGRPDGAPWTRCGPAPAAAAPLAVDWAERGVVVCGGGDYDPAPLLGLAEAAGWPVLAEPSSNARYGPNALSAYGYLLGSPAFLAAHRPDIIVSAGRPGLSRGVLAFLRGAPGPVPARHVVLAQGPGRWADPVRTATDVTAAVRLSGPAPGPGRDTPWLAAWRRADTAARQAADAVLDAEEPVTEPRLARDLAAALPRGALLWAGPSLPVRDLDEQMSPRGGLRVLCNRGVNGIDGLVSSAIGAALAHQARVRADRRPRVPARPRRAAARPGRAPARPVHRRGQQRRRRHLLHAGAGGIPRPVRAAVRHPARVRSRAADPGRRAGAHAAVEGLRARGCAARVRAAGRRGAHRPGRRGGAAQAAAFGLRRPGLALQGVQHRAELVLRLGQLGGWIGVGDDAAPGEQPRA
jgi:2-succinyl-5-enolpyruvyl-6-hydroxy-3-cyclohexene-1-carboxylate synthase